MSPRLIFWGQYSLSKSGLVQKCFPWPLESQLCFCIVRSLWSRDGAFLYCLLVFASRSLSTLLTAALVCISVFSFSCHSNLSFSLYTASLDGYRILQAFSTWSALHPCSHLLLCSQHLPMPRLKEENRQLSKQQPKSLRYNLPVPIAMHKLINPGCDKGD